MNSLDRRVAIISLFAAALWSLFWAFELKKPCLDNGWGGSARIEYSRLCYNDLQPLYGMRNLHTQQFPYVQEKSYEYPVVIGMEMWLASLMSRDHVQFFYANLPFLAASALLSVWGLILALGATSRVLWFAFAPPLILYSFHNWDLLAVAPLVLAMGAWGKKRDLSCGVLLGIGASAKLFPGFIFPALWITRFQSGDRKGALQLFYGIIGGYLLCNAPIWIACFLHDGDFSGWLAVFQFHSRRLPDFGTVWAWIPGFLHTFFQRVPDFLNDATSQPYKVFVDRASFFLFGGGTLAILAHQWIKKRDPWATGGAIIALFLLVAKVHSPQYALWILPFFVVTRTPIWLILAFYTADLVLFVSGFSWYATSPDLVKNGWTTAFIVSVYLRAAVLLAFLGISITKGEDLFPQRQPKPLGLPQA